MTVDSTYKPESCPNLRQTFYSSQFENDGPDVFKVVKVSGNGDRLVLDRGYHYQIVEPEVQTPYNYRCDIVLAAPLTSDAHLEVFRKTPIATEFNPQPLKRFDATTLEYEVDIITFIQQEIEGHACACPIYPPYVGEPEIPDLAPPNPALECQPYSCDAFSKGIGNLSPMHWFKFDQGGPTPSSGVNDEIPDSGSQDDGPLVIQSDWGRNVPESGTGQGNCQGFNWYHDSSVFRRQNTVTSFEPTFNMTMGFTVSTSNYYGPSCQIKLTDARRFPDIDNLTLGISHQDNEVVLSYPGFGAYNSQVALPEGLNHVCLEYMGDPLGQDPINGDWWDALATWRVYVNGVMAFELVGDGIRGGGGGDSYQFDGIWSVYESGSGVVGDLWVAPRILSAAEWTDIAVAWNRNDPNYEAPPHCTPTGE